MQGKTQKEKDKGKRRKDTDWSKDEPELEIPPNDISGQRECLACDGSVDESA